MWTAVWSIIGSRAALRRHEHRRVRQHHAGRDGQPGRPGRVRRHDRRLPGQLVLLPQARHPALAVGGRGGAVGRAGHRASRASAACCSAATSARARTCPGRSASRRPLAHEPRLATTTSRLYELPRGGAVVVPGAPDADLRVDGRPVLFAMLMLIRKYRTFSGQVFLGWVLGYGIMRPLIEIVRDDDQRGNVGPLSTSQFIGIVSVVLGHRPVHRVAAQVPARSGQPPPVAACAREGPGEGRNERRQAPQARLMRIGLRAASRRRPSSCARRARTRR